MGSISFDPNPKLKFTFTPLTPELKSSPIPITFTPFKKNAKSCYLCGTEYSKTLLFEQKYCEKCLSLYNNEIKYMTNMHFDVDVYVITNNSQCNDHRPIRNTKACKQNTKEWCGKCSTILYFKQIVTQSSASNLFNFPTNLKQIEIQGGKSCEQCGQLLYQVIDITNSLRFRLCSCYQITSNWTKSILTKESIPILYLPWWDAFDDCVACGLELDSISDCQKWCSHCIIVYIGCRYCLTTNVIFGIAGQSKCKKCGKISSITIDSTSISSGNRHIDDFINSTRSNIDNINNQIANYMNTSDPLDVYYFIQNVIDDINSKLLVKWIPYSQIKGQLEKIAEGKFGIIYKANWLDKFTVAIKQFKGLQNISGSFFNELKSLYKCYNMAFVVKCYGITQDPATKEYMLVMEYANGGNLHDYLKTNFINITWNTKLYILWKIVEGLNSIHNKNFIHRDFHSGNILLSPHQTWLIADLGLSQPANSSPLNGEIYGVIPYVAPEVFNGAGFSKASDVYSMGMIMWELTAGCKPFANVKHDINLIINIFDGERPEITEDTPECYANLMKSCWNADPSKRPSIIEIREFVYKIYKPLGFTSEFSEIFKKAEEKRLELIQLKKLGPSEKSHANAYFRSRLLNPFMSELSSVGLSSYSLSSTDLSSGLSSYSSTSLSSIDLSSDEYYITKELDLDIYIQGQNTLQENPLNTQYSNAIYANEPLNKLTSTINSSKTHISHINNDNFNQGNLTFIPKVKIENESLTEKTNLAIIPKSFKNEEDNLTEKMNLPSEKVVDVGNSKVKPRLCKWNEEAVNVLLNCIKRHKDEVKELTKRNSGIKLKLWMNIAIELNSSGFSYSSKQCSIKWKNIKQNYKKNGNYKSEIEEILDYNE